MSSKIEFTRGTNVRADVVWPEGATPDAGLDGCVPYIVFADDAIAPYLSIEITDTVNRTMVVWIIVPGTPVDDSWAAAWKAFPHRSFFQINLVDADGNPVSTDRIEINVT